MKKSLFFLTTLLIVGPAFAQEATEAVASSGGLYNAIGAGLAIGLAAFGCGMAQGRVGGSAMEGIARNPQSRGELFVPMILALVFIESISIYALVIALGLSK